MKSHLYTEKAIATANSGAPLSMTVRLPPHFLFFVAHPHDQARKYAFVFAACSALPARALLTGVVVQARVKRHGSNEGRERCSPPRREAASPLAAGSNQRISPWGWRARVGYFRCWSSMGKRQNSRPVRYVPSLLEVMRKALGR